MCHNHVLFVMTEYDQPVFVWELNVGRLLWYPMQVYLVESRLLTSGAFIDNDDFCSYFVFLNNLSRSRRRSKENFSFPLIGVKCLYVKILTEYTLLEENVQFLKYPIYATNTECRLRTRGKFNEFLLLAIFSASQEIWKVYFLKQNIGAYSSQKGTILEN